MAVPNVFDLINKNTNLNSTISSNKLKKEMEEKNKEKAKIFGFLGMEAYEMYKIGNLTVPELDIYLEKAKEIEEEIDKIEAKKHQLEMETTGNSTCSCGYQLIAENKFCPKCGKPVENGMNTCGKCGKSVKSDMQFCPFCGNNMQADENSAENLVVSEMQKPMKECICGAMVAEGQFMCMECGRKIE